MHKDLKVFCTRVGELQENCYVVYDIESNEGIMIDPGDISHRIDMMVEPINIKYILLTHGHFDHISGVAHYKDMKSCNVVMLKNEVGFVKDKELNLGVVTPFEVDIEVDDGDILDFNKYKIKVISTPGHTAGSCCYILDKFMFTGDTLMEGSIGRWDLPTGSFKELRQSLRKLSNISEDYIVYPGHGMSSKLEFEKASNPCLKKL